MADETLKMELTSEVENIDGKGGINLPITGDDYDTIAAQFFAKDAEWHAYKTKKLLWKVDLHLLPWLVLMYTTNFLDRT